MNPGGADLPQLLAEQFRRQLRIYNRRMMWSICWIFVIGLGVAIAGLIPAIATAVERGSPTPGLSLDRLAGSLGVRPLSAFGFAYDHFDQEVRWHAAEEGLRTIEALKLGLEGGPQTAPGLADDLDALAATVRVAAERGVEFSLVMRLYAKDSLQAVCTLEERQGSFW